jgi:hypothetical protein
MKTMKMKMNRISLFWIFGLFWICLNGNSQETKLSRQERKEVRKAQLAANFNILDSLLNSKSFVLEADFLQDSYGNRIPVVSNLNFIKVDGSNGILQTGSNYSLGYNGVGGVTAEGSLGTWEINKDPKKLSYWLRFSLLTNIGHYDIFMTVMANNHAIATISGLGPGKLTWEGHLETVNNSRIFKGQETI